MNMYYQPLQVNSQLNPAYWDKFVRSRRGDGFVGPSNSVSQTAKNMFAINGKAPSRFMRPYRTSGGAFLTPPTEPARETDVTLFRADPDLPSAPPVRN